MIVDTNKLNHPINKEVDLVVTPHKNTKFLFGFGQSINNYIEALFSVGEVVDALIM